MTNKPNLADPKVRKQISDELIKKSLGRAVSVVFMNHINKLTKSDVEDVDTMMNAAVGELVQELLSAVADFGSIFMKFQQGKISREEAVSKMGGIDINEVMQASKEMEQEKGHISISKDLGL